MLFRSQPTEATEIQSRYYRERRTFHLSGPLRIRHLIYEWFKDANEAAAWQVFHVERANLQFFLSEEWWWQGPNAKTLVTNWGRGDSWIHFDIRHST